MRSKKPLDVLVGCECSGTVRDAFIEEGHNAVSCDILPTYGGFPHMQGDVRHILKMKWDLLIAHPPCTYLASSGAMWYYHPDDKHLPLSGRRPHPRFPDRSKHREEALNFFKLLLDCDIPRKCIENPVGIVSSRIRPPDQYIEPYQYGHTTAKKTGLWLVNLPLLQPTNVVKPEYHTYKNGRKDPLWHYNTVNLPREERQRIRSQTFKGIARAMAQQWGNL